MEEVPFQWAQSLHLIARLTSAYQGINHSFLSCLCFRWSAWTMSLVITDSSIAAYIILVEGFISLYELHCREYSDNILLTYPFFFWRLDPLGLHGVENTYCSFIPLLPLFSVWARPLRAAWCWNEYCSRIPLQLCFRGGSYLLDPLGLYRVEMHIAHLFLCCLCFRGGSYLSVWAM